MLHCVIREKQIKKDTYQPDLVGYLQKINEFPVLIREFALKHCEGEKYAEVLNKNDIKNMDDGMYLLFDNDGKRAILYEKKTDISEGYIYNTYNVRLIEKVRWYTTNIDRVTLKRSFYLLFNERSKKN